IQPENSYILVVGNADEVKEGLSRFGEVEMYDMYGNKVTEAALGDVTVGQVIDKYIAAIGGEEKLAEVESMTQVIDFEINGMKITNTTMKKGGKHYLNLTRVGEQEVNKIVFSDGKGKMFANGQSMDLPPQ